MPLNISISKENILSVSGDFIADVSDFAIEIPKIVSNKLSKNVIVNYQFKLSEK